MPWHALAITATGGEEYFAVMTVEKGQTPELKVEGGVLSAKVTAGGRKLRLDGDRLVLE